MSDEKNPFIEPENYWDGYQKNIDNLKNKPELLEFDKLCYELFEHQETGRRFIEILKERYLTRALSQKGTPTYQLDLMWEDGFKDFIRLLLQCVKSHKQRIQAGS